MSGDQNVFDQSSTENSTPIIFLKKDWNSVNDQSNGQYASGQFTLENSMLANSSKWQAWREAYLVVPMVLTLSGTSLGAAAGTADYAVGLKNWFGSVIHSMSVDMAGTTIVQTQPFLNMWNAFRLMTTLSYDDVVTQGASIGFYPDNALAVFRQSAASLDGLGVCNNRNAIAATPVAGGLMNSYDNGNVGFLKRQQYINYDPFSATETGAALFNSMLTATACNALYKSYICGRSPTANFEYVQYAITATIKLRHLHPFFDSVPLMRGSYFRCIFNLNQPQISATVVAGPLINATTVNVPGGGVNPVMLASLAGTNGGAGLGAGTLNASLVVGSRATWSAHPAGALGQVPVPQTVQLYIPLYTFSSVYEQAYLSNPIKKIVYSDMYQFTIQNVAAGATFNSNVTNGIAGLQSVLVLPFHTSTANNGILPYQSPYDPAGCGPTSPLCLLNNYQVTVSGQNMLYSDAKYSHELFLNQLSGVNSINNGLTDGLCSGLIGALDFETEYCYHYADCSRMNPDEMAVPKSVQIKGQNQSALAVDLIVFCTMSCQITVDVLTGARV